jgi:hypothetical protein
LAATCPPRSETRAQVEKIARSTAALIGLGRDLYDDEITVLEGWAGEGRHGAIVGSLCPGKCQARDELCLGR